MHVVQNVPSPLAWEEIVEVGWLRYTNEEKVAPQWFGTIWEIALLE